MMQNILFVISIFVSTMGFSACIDDTVYTTGCQTSSKNWKCRFNATGLHVDTASTIQFVNYNGQRVKCKKNMIKRANIWHGTCDGNARDANFVRRPDKNGVPKVYGSIRIGSDVCQFGPNAYGYDEMSCKSSTEFIEEDDPIEAPPLENDYHERTRNLHFGFNPSLRNDTDTTHSLRRRTNTQRILYDDSGSTIDVMVVWTKEAECKNSKLQPGCTLTATTESNMRGLIDLAVAETNTAYELSGMLSSLRLVHAYRHPTYVEPTTTPYKTALAHLRSVADGNLDDVHAKRALYGADMVQLLISNPTSCGIAYLTSGKTSAFSIVQAACATGYYSYAHEIGHNFVLNHDRGTELACNSSLTSFNYGYRAPDATFRSIMAYECKTTECDKMPKTGCIRVQRFSNTQFLYNGKPMGDTLNDNAKHFNSLRSVVASHYPAMNCNSNSQCNDNDATTVDTCNTAKAVCVFTPIVPTNAPTRAPTKIPTIAPTKTPTRTPTNIPTRTPTKVPTNAPTKVPLRDPTPPPSMAPTKVPTRTPTKIPTKTPTRIPTAAPIIAATNAPIVPVLPTPIYNMESKVISNVTSSVWTTVLLQGVYASPIPVCTVQYDTGITLLPAVTRIQNVRSTSFDVRIQNPSNQILTERIVHCVIVEEGAYNLPDGRKIEAKQYKSTVTDHDLGWVGQAQTYLNRYVNPIVLGQVITYADTRWSVFYSRASSNRSTPPNTQSLRTGKHLGEDAPITRLAEMVGYIVIEKGHATYGTGIEMECGRTAESVVGYVERKYTQSFAVPFTTKPMVTVVSQAGMNGGEGSWALITGNTTASYFDVAVDEDQIADPERSHPVEEVDYIAFTTVGVISLTK